MLKKRKDFILSFDVLLQNRGVNRDEKMRYERNTYEHHQDMTTTEQLVPD